MFPGLVAALLAASILFPGSVDAMQSAPMVARGTLDAQQAYADRLQRMALDGPTERAAAGDPDQNPRRARRAEAAAALINAGDCPGALALAEREGDRRLAARITLVCGEVTVSTPAQAPRAHN
ncbi:hypothetical protein [Brevundimonas sp. TWP2-3-4b1]|uniref:hypothetical protein n=1 Tax=Brevundimonas sp. TWP2-3-4b1 TaxID=2804580 RepID=UPI003CF8DC61